MTSIRPLHAPTPADNAMPTGIITFKGVLTDQEAADFKARLHNALRRPLREGTSTDALVRTASDGRASYEPVVDQ